MLKPNFSICRKEILHNSRIYYSGRRLKHLHPQSEKQKKKLQAPAIWKSSSQISNFKKCSINCAVVIQCQQVTHAQSSLIHKAIHHSVATSISKSRSGVLCVKSINQKARCEERSWDDGNQKVKQAKEGEKQKGC